MADVQQAKGMDHIRNLKWEAIEMWQQYDCRSEMWIDCIDAVLKKHRLEIYRLKHSKDFEAPPQIPMENEGYSG